VRKEAEKELIDSGIVTGEEIGAAREKSRADGGSFLIHLLESCDAKKCSLIAETLAQHYKIPFLSLNKVVPPARLMELCRPEQARKLHFLPIAEHGGQVVVGMVDPIDLNYGDEIRAIFQKSVQPVFISISDFDRNYYRFYRKGVSIPEENSVLMDTQVLQKTFLEDSESTELSDEQRQAIAKKFAAMIISKALANGASSFSIEPQQDVALVNISIDGSEYNLFRISISNHEALVDAMMRLARIDPPKHEGIDQFSRCQVKYKDRLYVLAYSFRITPAGECVVVHIIDSKLNELTIDQLGLSNKGLDRLKVDMESSGLIIATGPSGSGKSTILQVLTRYAASLGKNAYTVEDIVGLKIEGIRQFQINPQGPSKGRVMQAIQKKGAEVVVVDEADESAIQAALDAVENGALVLLSITAPDISEAIAKLLRTGVSRSRLAPSLKLICTHKTIRRICPECKTTAKIYPQTRAHWQLPDQITFSTGKGCDHCGQSGYSGTISLTELLSVSENLSGMILDGASGPEIVENARHEGMLTLIEQGINKAIDGTTSLEEVIATMPNNYPFSVKAQMRMGRIMPLQKDGAPGPAAKDKVPESPFQPKVVGGSSLPSTDKRETIDFAEKLAEEPAADAEKPKIIKEEEKAPSPVVEEVAPPAETTASSDQQNMANILLVDDSAVTLEFTRHILTVSGYFNVDVCDTAKKALNMLQEKQYHLVITDQEMPEQTGQEFIESIRQHPSLNSVGTILLTGNLNEMSALEGGADGYIAKPTDPELLIARAKSISDIYKRLASVQPAPAAAPLATQLPSSKSITPGKVEFTESDMAKVASFELDVPGSAAPASENESQHEEPPHEESDSSDFNELFK
jgi:type IV pilus assembly protein PilB